MIGHKIDSNLLHELRTGFFLSFSAAFLCLLIFDGNQLNIGMDRTLVDFGCLVMSISNDSIRLATA